ncbi:aldo/keto reductase [Candidatus Leptofilum sp.]|uniref:aldo/keto reductase n=1 Tax=Candidatus Leptofilum sp. TaxID=3241576 RepID=UPI003B59B973
MSTTNNLKLRQLGQTDILISPIGLGCWQFSEGQGGARGSWDPVSVEETNGIVQAALDGGINWFDTAELYGHGRSERAIARALKLAGKSDSEVIVATKWNPLGRTARSIGRTIGERQECLNGYTIDLHQIHVPVGFTTRRSEMNAMADLVEAGKIRSIGISNFSARQMRRAHEVLLTRGMRLASNQVRYNLLNRRIETNGVLDTAKELGVTIIGYSPLDSGLLTGKFHKNPELLNSRPFLRRSQLRRRIESSRELVNALENIAQSHGVTASQVAINWLLNFHGDTVVVIPGASKVRHAEQNVGAMTFTLSDAELSRIDNLSKQFK